jgi:hypothetical protein
MTKIIKFKPENELQAVNVHSSAIHIENKVGLKSRLAWFYMLFKAFPTLKTENKFTVTIGELKQAIGYTSKNNKIFKELLSELTSVKVEWNIFNKTGEVWEVNTLLAGLRVQFGTNLIEYAYSPFLTERLVDPEMYVKINLLISKRFKSKHSLSIYCLALDYLYIKNNFGIKNFTLEEMRKYLGLEDHEYRQSGELYKHIIKKAEGEINSDSDMRIKITPIRADREKITGFQIEMSIKDDNLTYYKPQKLIEAPQEQKTQLAMFEAPEPNKIVKREIITVKNEVLKKYFASHKISITTDLVQGKLAFISDSLGKDHLEEYLLFLMDYTDRENQKGAVNKLSGFYINLLKDDTQLDNYIFYLEQSQKRAEEKLVKTENLLDSKIKIKYEGFLSEDFKKYLTSNINHLEEKFIELMTTTIPTDSMAGAIISKNSKGKIDKSLILDAKNSTKIMVFRHLEAYKTDLGYIPISFEEWKNKTVNEIYLSDLRKEIEKEIV